MLRVSRTLAERAPGFGLGEWVHIAVTVEGSTAKLYVNGVVVETKSNVSGVRQYGDGPIVIGGATEFARNAAYPRGFHGLIDELDLFDSALGAEDIWDIYSAGSAGKCVATDNTAPEVHVGPYSAIDEGGTFKATATVDDEGSNSWTATVDYGDGTVESPAVIGTSVDLSHQYAQDGTYTVTVSVTDDAAAEGSTSVSVVVNDVAPSVDAGPDARILEGSVFVSEGSFTDPGVNDSWSATVDYGDGSGIQPLALSGMSFELSHTYAGGGSGPLW